VSGISESGDEAADGEKRGSPAGQDACPVQRDAEDEAAGQKGDALGMDCGLQQTDVAGGNGGWLIWMLMKISPATAPPADRLRVVAVMAMVAPSQFGPRRAPREYLNRRKGRCEPASPHDVVDVVTPVT
jgi:hypothetical protein